MPKRDLIVIGASAGGVEALKTVVAGLPAGLPAAVLVVLHVPGDLRSALPEILARTSRLPCAHAREDRALALGTITVAPPDRHLTVRGGRVHLSRGPRVNGHRPAADPLFQTAAVARGNRVIGVILSGALDDGAAGMVDIRSAGGITIVQDPDDALYAGMPRSVLELTSVDHVLPASEIPAALVALAGREVPHRRTSSLPEENMSSPTDQLEIELASAADPSDPASGMTCPECHGSLWLKTNGDTERYRCRVGHTYTPKGLFAAQSEALEDTIWASYRALEESASLAQRLADRARNKQGLPLLAERYERKHADAEDRADVIRAVLERGRIDADDDETDAFVETEREDWAADRASKPKETTLNAGASKGA